MKKTNTVTKSNSICKGCCIEYNRDNVARVFGNESRVYLLGYHSAACLTASTMKQDTTPDNVKDGLVEICGSVVPLKEVERVWREHCTTQPPAPPTTVKEVQPDKYANMPKWDEIRYDTWKSWAEACFDAGKNETACQTTASTNEKEGHTLVGKLFVDAGDYERLKEPDEIFIRVNIDDETFDVCRFSSTELANPIIYAERIVKCWNEYDGLKAENERAKQQIIDLIEALKPFAELFNELPQSRVKQGLELYQYDKTKLMVSDFEKASDLLSYLSQHQVK